MLIAITCTKYDFLVHRNSLAKSVDNIKSVFGEGVFFLVVIQYSEASEFDFSPSSINLFP